MTTRQVMWIGSKPDKCDLCADTITDVFIDGKTVYGPWGILCPKCHKKFGMGLGLGRGQKYSREGQNWIKVER